jgi:hypothetical protein
MAKIMTGDDLFAELVAALYTPILENTDVTANRICAAIVDQGGRASPQKVEKQLDAKVEKGELNVVRKKSPNGRMVKVYERVV